MRQDLVDHKRILNTVVRHFDNDPGRAVFSGPTEVGRPRALQILNLLRSLINPETSGLIEVKTDTRLLLNNFTPRANDNCATTFGNITIYPSTSHPCALGSRLDCYRLERPLPGGNFTH